VAPEIVPPSVKLVVPSIGYDKPVPVSTLKLVDVPEQTVCAVAGLRINGHYLVY
jgi:hypothetical protein